MKEFWTLTGYLLAGVVVVAITNAMSLYVTVPLNAIFIIKKTFNGDPEFTIEIGGILKPSNVKLDKFNNNNFWVYLISTMIWNKNQNSSVFESELNIKKLTTWSQNNF